MATTHTKRIIYKVDDSGLKAARRSLSDTSKTTKDLEEQTKKYGKEMEDAGKKGSKAFLTIKDAIGLISFAAVVEGARRLVTEVIRVSAEFQKLEAVLTTTLGSKSKAQLALAQIKNFASTTPYQVEQLSSAFVKLANQGLVMTTRQMRNLGDLAASTGKDFDMLAEAIIDAQVGEFERLKEFGIRASKQGDQVMFTFKGVKEQVDFTAESIQKYIIGLGQVEGVSGSMAAISETLGGQMSNLGDKFTTFFDNLGKQTDGVLVFAIEQFQDLMDVVNETLMTLEDRRLRDVSGIYEGLVEGVEELDKAGLKEKLEELSASMKLVKDQERELGRAAAHGTEGDGTIERYEAIKREVEAYAMSIAHVVDEIEKKENAEKEELESLEQKYQQALTYLRETNKQAAELKEIRLGEEYRKWADTIKKELLPAQVDLNKSLQESLEIGNKAADEQLNKDVAAAGKVYDAWKESYDKQIKDAKAAAERKKEVQEEIRDTGIDIINELLVASVQARQVDWEDFYSRRNDELALAGNNADARAAIERRFQEEEARLRKKQAEEEKKATIKRMLIDTAANAVRALGTPPTPNFIAAALATAFGLAQVATVRGFKDGVIDLDGPGSTTSDSIPARLSRGESVITAKSTARSKEMLRDIEAGKIDDKTYKMWMAGTPVINAGGSFDDRNIVKAIEKNGPPDYQRVGSILYESRTIGEGMRQKIRRKVIN